MELGGEVGEAQNAAKKLIRFRNGWAGGSNDPEHLAEELADTVICADLAAMAAGIDLGAAVVAKFNATSERHGFPERLTLDAQAVATPSPQEPPHLPFDRDELGRFVRLAWIRWAKSQPHPKDKWLTPYEQLGEPDKEADRQIGEEVARWVLGAEAERLSPKWEEVWAKLAEMGLAVVEADKRIANLTRERDALTRAIDTIAASRSAESLAEPSPLWKWDGIARRAGRAIGRAFDWYRAGRKAVTQ
jgi:hypothetical protein